MAAIGAVIILRHFCPQRLTAERVHIHDCEDHRVLTSLHACDLQLYALRRCAKRACGREWKGKRRGGCASFRRERASAGSPLLTVTPTSSVLWVHPAEKGRTISSRSGSECCIVSAAGDPEGRKDTLTLTHTHNHTHTLAHISNVIAETWFMERSATAPQRRRPTWKSICGGSRAESRWVERRQWLQIPVWMRSKRSCYRLRSCCWEKRRGEKRASHASMVAPPSTCRSPTEMQERRLFQHSKHAVFNESVHLNEEVLSNERRARHQQV